MEENLAIIDRIRHAKKIENLTVPGFKGTLKEFQKKGVLWMYFRKRGVLADQCGLGKSVELLALACLLQAKGARRILIAVPSNSLIQWTQEANRFTNLFWASAGRITKEMRLMLYGSASWNVLFINHELIARDVDYLMQIPFDAFFLDEASVIKNPEAKTSQAVKVLADKTTVFMTASATPVQNNVMDLHSIMEAVDKSVLPNQYVYRRRYCEEEEFYLNVRFRSGKTALRKMRKIVGSKNLNDLRTIVDPYILRRRISEVEEELPEVSVKEIWLDLESDQKKEYDELKKKTRKSLENGDHAQVKKNVHVIQQTIDGTRSGSPKLDKIMELLRGDLAEDKVVIFGRYKSTLHALKRLLDDGSIGNIEISGDVSKEEREISRKRFWEDPACKVCFGTSALEMSLNLQIARYMILLNSQYNPARVDQLLGRIRRIGSEHRSVCLIYLYVHDTIEDKLYHIVRKRQQDIDDFLQEKSDIFETMTEEELKEILNDD